MTQQRKCLFCGNPANSREHVIAEWLTKQMQRENDEFMPAHFDSVRGVIARPLTKFKYFRTRQVCQQCNGGWMSDLEKFFKDKLGDLVEPNWSPLSDEFIERLRREKDLLIRWLLKTATIVECAHPKSTIPVVVNSLYETVTGKTPPVDFHIYAAHIVPSDIQIQLTKGFPTWNGGVLHEYQIHNEGLNFRLQLNHLALWLIRCPGAPPIFKISAPTVTGECCVPICVTQPAIFPFRVTHSFPLFSAFLDTIEINANIHQQPN